MATQIVTTSTQIGSSVPAVAHRLLEMTYPNPTPPLMRTRVRREEKAIKNGEKLLVDMIPLVKSVALRIRKRLPAHVEISDLISDGMLGLVDALAKFNPRKRVKLESYARHRIGGSILDGLRRADLVPRELRRKHKTLEKHYRALEAKLGRPAKDEEMAAGLGLNLAQWHRELNEIQSAGIDSGARALSAAPVSVPRSADPELLADDGPNPFDNRLRLEQREILSRALSHLGERERQIITLYYERGLTMQEIGNRMNVDASRVSQLHAAALVRLKADVSSLIHSTHAGVAKAAPRSMAARGGA
jgi:RNA polymerase sigma factor FliA